jgi:hypothetical protein
MADEKYLIDSLTPEQEAKFPEYEERFVNIGLATGEDDLKNRADIVKNIGLVYQDAELTPPPVYLHLKSPLACVLALNYLESIEDKWKDDPANLVKTFVKDDTSLKDLMELTKGMSLKNYEACYGQFEASWLVFYMFFQEEFNLEKCPTLDHLEALLKSGWFFPMDNICAVSGRHMSIHRDEDNRLHNLEAPALAFSDDFNLYAVHGVRVPEYIIERPEEITVDLITTEANAEVRRVMLDKFGLDRFIKESGAKLIDSDEKIGDLYVAEFEDDEALAMVRLINSTPETDGTSKEYWMRVTPGAKTAREAVAWMHPLDSLEGDSIPADLYEPITES